MNNANTTTKALVKHATYSLSLLTHVLLKAIFSHIRVKVIFLTLFLTPLLSLTGCGVYRGNFDCKPGKGVGCESVSQVNDLINNETLDDFIEEVSSAQTNNPKKRGNKHHQHKDHKCKCKQSDKTNNETPKSNEKLKIHFNEYKDANGILHKPSEIELEVK